MDSYSLTDIWQTLDILGFEPWIAIFGIIGYFTMRAAFNLPKGQSVLAVLTFNIVGQMYLSPPDSLETLQIYSFILKTLFFSSGQAFVAFGIYSFIEWTGAIDILKEKVLTIVQLLLGKATDK